MPSETPDDLITSDSDSECDSSNPFDYRSRGSSIESNSETESSLSSTSSTSSPTPFSMIYQSKWYNLFPLRRPNPSPIPRLVESLDVHVLFHELLSPLLGIHDIQNNSDVVYCKCSLSFSMLTLLVNSSQHPLSPKCPSKFQSFHHDSLFHDSVIFCVNSVSVDSIMMIALQGDVLPPKATCFEPKIPPGIFLTQSSTSSK